MKRLLILINLISILLIGIYSVSYLYTVTPIPLNWDEIDYMYASKKGMLANATEQGSMDIKTLIQFSLAKKNKDTLALANLSQTYKEEQDLIYRRHFHPPFPTYYWSLFQSDQPLQEQWNIRISNIILYFMSFAVFMGACFTIGGRNIETLSVSTLLAGFFFTSSSILDSYASLNFHIFHAIACILYVVALITYIERQNWKTILFLSLSIVFLIGTLEMCVLILGLSLILVLSKQYRKIIFSRQTLYLLAASIFFLLLLWPGFLTTGGLARAFIIYFYRFFFNNNDEYKELNYLSNLEGIVLDNPVVFAVIVVLLLLLIIRSSQYPKILFYICFIGIMYFFVMLRIIYSVTYIIPALSILIFTGVCVFIILLKNARYALNIQMVSICMICATLTYHLITTDFSAQYRAHQKTQNDFLSDCQTIAHYSTKLNLPCYANGSHILNYYLQSKSIIELERISIPNPDFYIRKNLQYFDLKKQIEKREIPVLVISKNMNYTSKSYAYLISCGYKQKSLHHYYLFHL